jgi:predicted 3-demethylubiquinone-9 3-methyltransferase (glyoxalase superfamily)
MTPSASASISPCLWFDHELEEAAEFYTGIFPNSRIVKITHYSQAGFEFHQKPAGSVMTVAFELDGQPFTGLNGGPIYQFTEALSLQVFCDSQEEVDHYWDRLSEGGDPGAQQCGWLKDRFGVSWQVIPRALPELIEDPESERSQRAMNAMLEMKKIDVAALQRASEG